jgi:hypothetical protein
MKKIFFILSLLSIPMVSNCMERPTSPTIGVTHFDTFKKSLFGFYTDAKTKLTNFKNTVSTTWNDIREGFNTDKYYSKTITKYSAYTAAILAVVTTSYFGYKKYGQNALNYLKKLKYVPIKK